MNATLPQKLCTNDHPSFLLPPDFDSGPDVYAMSVTGDCVEPTISDGDHLICSSSEEPRPGDFVAIWFAEPDGKMRHQPICKRLVIPFRRIPAPGSGVSAGVIGTSWYEHRWRSRYGSTGEIMPSERDKPNPSTSITGAPVKNQKYLASPPIIKLLGADLRGAAQLGPN